MTVLAPARRLALPPEWGSDAQAIQHGPLRVLISPKEDHAEEGQWRHVSVSCESRLPTYEELGAVREAYFDAAATVVQVMPPASQWVNQHEFCLHLWQRLDAPLLPQGLHRSVGLRGGLPLDAVEKQLMIEGLPLFSLLRNLLRSRGTLTVTEAQAALADQVVDGSTPAQQATQLRGVLTHLASVPHLFHVTQDRDSDTFRWTGPA